MTKLVGFVIALAILVVLFMVDFYYSFKKKELNDEELRRTKYQFRVKWISLFVLYAIVAFLAFFPPTRDFFGYITGLLSSGDVNAVIDLIRDAGPWAVALSTFLMVFQSLAAPIPAFLITFANAAVFGWVGGAILSWSSAMLAAALCFFIARWLGRDAVALFMSKGALATIDKWFETYGKNAILICRLLPFMSFDYVSYAAGLTGMKFLDFFIWTGIGQLPATIIYSYVGSQLTGQIYQVFIGLCVLFVAAALAMLLRAIWKNKHKDLMEETEVAEGSEAESPNKEN